MKPKPRTDEAIRLLERLHWDVKKVPFCRVLASLEQTETELAEREDRVGELEAWKESASQVMNEIELQPIGKELGLTLGSNIGAAILPGIRSLKAENAKMREALVTIAKNPASKSGFVARQALTETSTPT